MYFSMKYTLIALLLLLWSNKAPGAAQLVPTKNAAGSALNQASSRQPSPFSSAQQLSGSPLLMEQDCPNPDRIDVVKGSSWNTVEIGFSLPLSVQASEMQAYSRYTCPAPMPRDVQ